MVAIRLPCCPGADGWRASGVTDQGHVGWGPGRGQRTRSFSFRPGCCPCAAWDPRRHGIGASMALWRKAHPSRHWALPRALEEGAAGVEFPPWASHPAPW